MGSKSSGRLCMASEHRRCGSLERMHVEKSLSLVCRLVICVLSAVSWEALARLLEEFGGEGRGSNWGA